ncbi:unnamed protein product [Ostreobium quekettii]|uniref:K Homology domain-containing protein n=1 Tax=Ostreobium quekettii TaxID=121088 RepID=A0A8S1JEL7_9CHLO|nr:unnamed protein product [Ostreobium quekettii]
MDEDVELKAEINVKREMVGAIIGRGGSTVTRIRSNSGAHVHIREASMGENEQTVELRGNRRQVRLAADEVKDVLMKEDEEYGRDNGDIANASIVACIPPEMVGCLIGKGGQNVKNIRATTGAQVRVDSLQEGENVQAVNIYGSIDQVVDAFQKVSEILRGFDPRKSRLLRNAGSQGGPVGATELLGGASGTPSMPANTNLMGVSLGGGVVGAGGVLTGLGDVGAVTAGMVQPAGNSAQQAFVIQTPTGGATPTILVLQPDGTFVPAPVIYQTLPTAQNGAGVGNIVQPDIGAVNATGLPPFGTPGAVPGMPTGTGTLP